MTDTQVTILAAGMGTRQVGRFQSRLRHLMMAAQLCNSSLTIFPRHLALGLEFK